MTLPHPKKIFVLAAVLLILPAVLYCAAAFIRAPAVAEEKARASLQIFGLDTSFLLAPESKWGHIVYKNISLDKDDISTIGSVDVSYNPFSILLSGRIDTLAFSGLNLIGEWNEETGVNFSGWKMPSNIQVMATIPTRRIRFGKAKISVLTPEFGGLSLDFGFESSINGRKLEFQSSLKSAQRFISFTANANGIIAHDYSNIEIEIDEGKFEVPDADIRASRSHGWLNYARDKSGAVRLMAELRAGGLTVLDMPWQNAAATLELKDGNIKIFSDAKSVGVEGIELGLNLQQDAGKKSMIYGSVHADNGAAFADYLAGQHKIALPKADMTIIKHALDLKTDFVYEPGKIKYRLNTMENAPVKEIPIK
ncbi:MAG: hypothetical protein WBK55_00080 [Alphaproteobacteria bacterium]